MDSCSTVELVRSLERVMRQRIALRRTWALMRAAKRRYCEGIFAEVEHLLLQELERRRALLH